jgi:hypothetical protein
MENSFVKLHFSLIKKMIKRLSIGKYKKFNLNHNNGIGSECDIDYETPCGQTLAEQKYLLSSLCKEAQRDKDNVIEFLTFLQKLLVEEKVSHQELITIVSHLSFDGLASFLPQGMTIDYLDAALFTQAMDLDYSFMDKINDLTNYFVITNPHVANLLLLRPALIKALSQKIKQSFIFPAYPQAKKFFLEWGTTFSDVEYNKNHYWRWAFFTAESHSITLVNNTPNIQTLHFRFSIRTKKRNADALFEIYFLNHKSCYSESRKSNIEFQLSLPPGRHQLKFVYSGQSSLAADDIRELHFAISDLIIRLGSDIFEKEQVFSQPSGYFNPVNDRIVRSVLHEGGFFEVSAIAKSFYFPGEQRLPVTRFHLVNQFYCYEKNQPNPIDADVIWYIAKRCPTFKEE